MRYRISTISIIGQVVGAMTFPVIIKTVEMNDDGTQTLTVCDLYHAQEGFPVHIGANQYRIEEIIYPDLMRVSEGPEIEPQTFELYHPVFKHGTPIATGVELQQIPEANEKTPMVWFMEQFEDDPVYPLMSPFERRSKFRLFFLTQGNHKEWTTDEAYEKAIIPMRRLQEKFEQEMINNLSLFNTDQMQVTVRNYAKFGVFISEKGMPKGLFADKLTGCEMDIKSLDIYRDGICVLDCTPPTPEPPPATGIGEMIIEQTFEIA